MVMDNRELLDRIAIDPQVCFGKPCLRGHRSWVSLILDVLASGATTADLLDEYPQLDERDVLACLAYGAALAGGHWVDVVAETPE